MEDRELAEALLRLIDAQDKRIVALEDQVSWLLKFLSDPDLIKKKEG